VKGLSTKKKADIRQGEKKERIQSTFVGNNLLPQGAKKEKNCEEKDKR